LLRSFHFRLKFKLIGGILIYFLFFGWVCLILVHDTSLARKREFYLHFVVGALGKNVAMYALGDILAGEDREF
jgi:phosphate starvation-inducible membrane PsiE